MVASRSPVIPMSDWWQKEFVTGNKRDTIPFTRYARSIRFICPSYASLEPKNPADSGEGQHPSPERIAFFGIREGVTLVTTTASLKTSKKEM
jgi:hypothetical protein